MITYERKEGSVGDQKKKTPSDGSSFFNPSQREKKRGEEDET